MTDWLLFLDLFILIQHLSSSPERFYVPKYINIYKYIYIYIFFFFFFFFFNFIKSSSGFPYIYHYKYWKNMKYEINVYQK